MSEKVVIRGERDGGGENERAVAVVSLA